MKNLRLAAAAALAGLMVLLSSGAAQAYPDCGIALTLKINKTPLTGGKTFGYVADAGDVRCDWTVTYRGKTQTHSGTSISGSFSTKVVSKSFTSKIIARCSHQAGQISAPISQSNAVTPAIYSTQASATLQSLTQVCPVSADITLLPRGVDTGGTGALPNTGGSNLWIIVVGGVLLIGGGGAILASRRRSTH